MKCKLHIASACLLALFATDVTLAQSQRTYPASSGVKPVTFAACEQAAAPPAVAQALHLVCAKENIEPSASVRQAIIICFLGGFVKADDAKHPEVWFARYLRDRYGPNVRVLVFGNREEQKAIRDITRLVEPDTHKSSPPPAIILYGHSWGGAQVLTFARDLGREGIPVSLTIQIDSVHKLGQDGHTVPGNVAKAVNFYQTHSLTPGETHIVPADPAQTTILGNFRMTYDHRQINCDNYKWLSRVFNKPHHQIENDPQVWELIAKLIDSELSLTKN